jgi:hypothetical protein
VTHRHEPARRKLYKACGRNGEDRQRDGSDDVRRQNLVDRKKYPVALVRIVVVRKSAVQPALYFDPSMAAATTSPATIPTRLSATCSNVNAGIDIPRIMMCLLMSPAPRP